MCIRINIAGTTVAHLWIALELLGIGWNFLLVGEATLLTETCSPNEKAKAQALNDFIVFGTVAPTSFSSGAVHHTLGWQTINMVVSPFLVLLKLPIYGCKALNRQESLIKIEGGKCDRYEK